VAPVLHDRPPTPPPATVLRRRAALMTPTGHRNLGVEDLLADVTPRGLHHSWSDDGEEAWGREREAGEDVEEEAEGKDTWGSEVDQAHVGRYTTGKQSEEEEEEEAGAGQEEARQEETGKAEKKGEQGGGERTGSRCQETEALSRVYRHIAMEKGREAVAAAAAAAAAVAGLTPTRLAEDHSRALRTLDANAGVGVIVGPRAGIGGGLKGETAGDARSGWGRASLRR